MQQIPSPAREYLSSNDALVRAQLFQVYPDLRATLGAAQTRTAILNWLATSDAWESSVSGFTLNCLDFLRSGANQQEVSIIRSFLLHPNPYLRLRAYEYLLTLYFPDKNREAMFILLHGMLSDNDDAVRVQAARYIERTNAVTELQNFLQNWLIIAPSRGWNGTESFELVERLMRR